MRGPSGHDVMTTAVLKDHLGDGVPRAEGRPEDSLARDGVGGDEMLAVDVAEPSVASHKPGTVKCREEAHQGPLK